MKLSPSYSRTVLLCCNIIIALFIVLYCHNPLFLLLCYKHLVLLTHCHMNIFLLSPWHKPHWCCHIVTSFYVVLPCCNKTVLFLPHVFFAVTSLAKAILSRAFMLPCHVVTWFIVYATFASIIFATCSLLWKHDFLQMQS